MPSCAPTAGLSGSWIGYDNTSSYSSGGNNAFLGGLLTYGEFGVGACGSCTGYNTTTSSSGGSALFSSFSIYDSWESKG
jgi:hypothetical protein